jgi:hypothetical protein
MTEPDAPGACSRCGRGLPANPLVEGWEHNLDTVDDALTANQLVWVCPKCLTGAEEAAIEEEVGKIIDYLDEQARSEEHQGVCSRCGKTVDLRSAEAAEWAAVSYRPFEPLAGMTPTDPLSAFVCPDCLTDDERLLAQRLGEEE